MDPRRPRDSSEKKAPQPGGGSDGGSAMDPSEQGRAPLQRGADDSDVVELLSRWDELSAADLEALAEEQSAGRRLRLLMQVQDWLTSDLPDSRCPEPDALYDFARGPGYVTLAAAHRRSISDHLEHCHSCSTAVASLEASPPLPLDLAGPVEPEIAPAPRLLTRSTGGDSEDDEGGLAIAGDGLTGPPIELDRGRPVLVRMIPLAAAAAVLVIGFTMMDGSGTVGAGESLPSSPLLRGLNEEALLFPRGRALPPDSLAEGGFADRPHFELVEVPRASSYRVMLSSNSGGAFEEGELLLTLESEGPSLRSEVPLAEGHYTWEAWAVIDGLDRSLGERDFQVVDDSALRLQLLDLSPIARVRHLHEAGYLVDARWVARRLPASSERDAYLGVTHER